MKGLLKGLRCISRIFENEKEPKIQIGNPTDVKHVAHIGWEGLAETSMYMNVFKAPWSMSERFDEPKEGSSRKPNSSRYYRTEKQKGRRKSSTGTSNSPVDSPKRILGSTKQSKRNTGKHREQISGSGLRLPLQAEEKSAESKHSRQNKSKGSKENDISVRGVFPLTDLRTSTGR
ncbi:PREDICTED: CRIB domain-containing protein RIC5-like [Tarenaya hassleriana]|uniref:CRIB domain-containing protein RIC5-like n=1 Tax=Tarenaya hassleriana TaxID=28532 RepID=UPI00053C459B|nr:PREDICTED: CRIB domain-containing protein RIC5-like [Tarenaya hassleriana]